MPANYGAFDTFVDQFVKDENIINSNIFFFISTIYKNYTELGFPNVKQFYVPRLPGPLILNYLIAIIIMLTKGVRVFFLVMVPRFFFLFLKLLNCKIICNPDGIEWRRPNNIIKKNFFKICEFIFAKIKISKIYDSEIIKRYYLINYNSDGEKFIIPRNLKIVFL